MSAHRRLISLLAVVGAACSGDAITGPPAEVRLHAGVVLRASSEVQSGDFAEPSVLVRTIFVNAGRAPVTLHQGGCSVRLRARRASDGVVVFDESRLGLLCIESVRLVTLAPGAADTVLRRVPGSTFAGQPTTRFRLESVVFPSVAASDGTATVAAGTVRIP